MVTAGMACRPRACRNCHFSMMRPATRWNVSERGPNFLIAQVGS